MLRFGTAVRDGYQVLVRVTFASIARDPELAGSHKRSGLCHGLRTLHLRAFRDEVSPAARRIANPRHFVVYRQVDGVVEVVRLLHDAMNVSARHIPK